MRRELEFTVELSGESSAEDGDRPNGFPLQVGGAAQTTSFEVYGALPNTHYPVSYLYSLETQFELPYLLTFTVGYAGSEGHHYARLVEVELYLQPVHSPNFGTTRGRMWRLR